MTRQAISVSVAMCGLAWACGCSRPHVEGGGPVAGNGPEVATYTDLVGREARLPRHVGRIVLPRSKDIYLLAALLGESFPEKLIAWGPDLERDDAEVYAHLVARFPRLKQIPVTGSVYGDALNPEQIVALRPDLVILDKFMRDHGYRYTGRLEAAGLPVVYLDGSTDPLTGPQRGVRLLGEILGLRERASAIARYVDDRLGAVFSRIGANVGTPPSVYLEQGYLGPAAYADTYGSDDPAKGRTSWGTILHALKVRNIADGVVGRQAPIHPEYLLRADPDIIVITGQNWSNPGSMRLGCNVALGEATRCLKAFLARPGWEHLSAVRQGRVCAVFHNTGAITAFAGVQALAKYCYPDLFRDLDPEKHLREFHERFLPIDPGGTWACAIR